MNNNILIPYSRRRKLFMVFGVFVFTILIGLFSASLILKNKIENKLRSITGLSVEQVEISWRCQDVKVTGLNFSEPDIEDFNHRCKKISISGLNLWALWKHDKIKLDQAKIEGGSFNFINLKSKSDTIEKTQNKKLPDIFVKNFIFEKVDLSIEKRYGIEADINNFNGRIRNVSYQMQASNKSIDFESIDIQSGSGNYKKENGHYNLLWDSISLNHEDNKLRITNVELEPLHNEANWSNQFKFKKARLELKAEAVEIDEFDVNTLIQKQQFIADSISLEKAHLQVFTDQNSETCTDCYKALIHEKLYQVKIPISVGKIKLINNQIDVSVKSEKTQKTGSISFDQLYASIYNVQNTDNNKIHADLKTQFMGTSALDLDIDFTLSSPGFPYHLNGVLDDFKLRNINSFLYLNQRVKIESGHCKNLSFEVEGNNDKAVGALTFLYDKLEVAIFDVKDSDRKKVLSSVINKIGIKTNNTPESKDYSEGKIYYERVKNKGVFHQWIQAINSGIKSVILPDILLQEELK